MAAAARAAEDAPLARGAPACSSSSGRQQRGAEADDASTGAPVEQQQPGPEPGSEVQQATLGPAEMRSLECGTAFVYLARKALVPSAVKRRMMHEAQQQQKQPQPQRQQGQQQELQQQQQQQQQQQRRSAERAGGDEHARQAAAVPPRPPSPHPAVPGAPVPVPVPSALPSALRPAVLANPPGGQPSVGALGAPAQLNAAVPASLVLPAERWSAHVLKAARQPHLGLSLRKSNSFLNVLELSMSKSGGGIGGSERIINKRRRGHPSVQQSRDGSSGACAAEARRATSEVCGKRRKRAVAPAGGAQAAGCAGVQGDAVRA